MRAQRGAMGHSAHLFADLNKAAKAACCCSPLAPVFPSLGVEWVARSPTLLLTVSSGLLQIHGDTVQNQLVLQGVELPCYLPLYSPAMDWIFQCISYHAPEVTARGREPEYTARERCWGPSLLSSLPLSFSLVHWVTVLVLCTLVLTGPFATNASRPC